MYTIELCTVYGNKCQLFIVIYFSPREQKGIKAYPIPLGGTSNVGRFGYIDAFQELMNQVRFFQLINLTDMSLGRSFTRSDHVKHIPV